MSIFGWFSGLFGNNSASSGLDDTDIENSTSSDITSSWSDNVVNPANGMPMIGGMGGIDINGNPYGTDSSHEDFFSNDDNPFSNEDDFFSNHDDTFSSDDNFFSSFDDSFSSGGGFDDNW